MRFITERKMGSCKCGAAIIPFVAMVMVEVSAVGCHTLSKAAMLTGMNPYVFIVYSYVFATIILLPYFILVFSRRRSSPPLNFYFLCRFFLLSLIITAAMLFGYIGLDYSSPTLSGAMSNLVPAFTFILATIFRLEKLDIRSRSSQAKALGTIVSITGAIIVTLYKGQPIILPSTHYQLKLLTPPQSNWVIAGLCLAADWLLTSIWNIFQVVVVKQYPDEMNILFFTCFFGTFQSAVFTLITQRDISIWKLNTNIEFIAIAYTAIAAKIFGTLVHIWCLRIKGPIFVAIFMPFGTVVAVIMSVAILGDTLYIGSVIGAIVISFGLFGVMWGKSKEEKLIKDIQGASSSDLSPSPGVPLLINIQ